MATQKSELEIREFAPGDAVAFRRLNEEWIRRYFVLEPKDTQTLADPEGTILDSGGKIFLAVREGEAGCCCALLAMRPGGSARIFASVGPHSAIGCTTSSKSTGFHPYSAAWLRIVWAIRML